MLCVVIDYQEPANGVPNIPTASSAQTRNKVKSTIPQIIILFVKLFGSSIDISLYIPYTNWYDNMIVTIIY